MLQNMAAPNLDIVNLDTYPNMETFLRWLSEALFGFVLGRVAFLSKSTGRSAPLRAQ